MSTQIDRVENGVGEDQSNVAEDKVGSTFVDALRCVVFYGLSIMLVLSANSLYYTQGDNRAIFALIILVLSALLIAIVWATCEIGEAFLRRWALWVTCACAVFLSVVLFNCSIGSAPWHFYFALLALFPLLVHILRQKGYFQSFIESFVNVVACLGLVSTVLWLVCDVGHLLQPNCSVLNTWHIRGQVSEAEGYFYVLMHTQTTNLNEFPLLSIDAAFYRNTAIFVEGPMMSFVLCCALICETFLNKRLRKTVFVILALTILSTLTTTCIIVLALVCTALCMRVLLKHGYKALVLAVFAVGVAIAMAFVIQKIMQTGSGSTRLDDYRACFQVWLTDPLFGCGYDNTMPIRNYMSLSRITNTGVANSLGYALALGGLAHISLHVVAFAGYFVKAEQSDARASQRFDYAVAGLLFLFVWVITVVVTLPLAAFMLSIGVERFLAALPHRSSKSTAG